MGGTVIIHPARTAAERSARCGGSVVMLSWPPPQEQEGLEPLVFAPAQQAAHAPASAARARASLRPEDAATAAGLANRAAAQASAANCLDAGSPPPSPPAAAAP